MPSITERLNGWRFQRTVRSMLDTPAVQRGVENFAALSMVHRRDVLPYLLAIKTFAFYACPERVILVADPSLDETDRRLLLCHVPHIEIVPAAKFRQPALPVGGTWERLSAISMLCQESCIVQLDADTVTFARPTDVIEAARAGASFVIRSEAGVEIVSLDAAAAVGKRLLLSSNHIQAAAEARLSELHDARSYRYARGCSGFTGFGRGSLSADRLAAVSTQMRRIHAARWDEWGTEQVTSNLLAATAPGAFMLPHPRYCNADSLTPTTVLAHYIGYARFRSRDYEGRVAPAARALHAAGAPETTRG